MRRPAGHPGTAGRRRGPGRIVGLGTGGTTAQRRRLGCGPAHLDLGLREERPAVPTASPASTWAFHGVPAGIDLVDHLDLESPRGLFEFGYGPGVLAISTSSSKPRSSSAACRPRAPLDVLVDAPLRSRVVEQQAGQLVE